MRTITLSYRKIIDATSTTPWDKMVYEASYLEFRMQAQNYSTGTPYTSYADLLRNVPNAGRLPGMVSPAVTGYIRQLNGVFPDILNNQGRKFIKFSRFQLEIINSDINDKEKHQVAINFFSELLHWHDTIGEYLLLSDHTEDRGAQTETLTHLMQLQPYLSIHSIKNN